MDSYLVPLFLFNQIGGLWGGVFCFVDYLEEVSACSVRRQMSTTNGSSQDWLRWSGVGRLKGSDHRAGCHGGNCRVW